VGPINGVTGVAMGMIQWILENNRFDAHYLKNANYIFPDTTYLERWEFVGSHPSVTPKVFPIRQPVVVPLTETVRVYGEDVPLNVEAFVLGVAEKLNLPGFGKDVFGPGQHVTREEDIYTANWHNIWPIPPGGDNWMIRIITVEKPLTVQRQRSTVFLK